MEASHLDEQTFVFTWLSYKMEFNSKEEFIECLSVCTGIDDGVFEYYMDKYYDIHICQPRFPRIISPSLKDLYVYGEDIEVTVDRVIRLSNNGYFSFVHPELQFISARIMIFWSQNHDSNNVDLLCKFIICLQILGSPKNHPFMQTISEIQQDNISTDYRWIILSLKCNLRLEKIGLMIPNVNEVNEAYTDIAVIKQIRNIYGDIDVDIAGNYLTSQQIRPLIYYSKFNDGLHEDSFWFGNVLLNPPYTTTTGKRDILSWINRALTEFKKVTSRITNLFIIVYIPNNQFPAWRVLLKDNPDACKVYTLRRKATNPYMMNGYYYSGLSKMCFDLIDKYTYELFHYSKNNPVVLQERFITKELILKN